MFLEDFEVKPQFGAAETADKKQLAVVLATKMDCTENSMMEKCQ